MKQSALLTVLTSTVLAAAHGIVSDLKIGGTLYGGYNPFQDPYMNPAPQRIVWSFPTAGNGPVEDVSSTDIVCNKGATAAPLSAPVTAGSSVTFFWTTWPESHKGPHMTYLAPTDSHSADPSTLSYFKIAHAGLNADGSWASDDVIRNNNSLTVTIPSDIAPGKYILRHELLALHSAFSQNGAQFYPLCANLVVSGGGSAKPAGVKFPGAYKATDPGVLVDIYQGIKSYVIPGPDVYSAGGAATTKATTTSAAATSAATTKATTTAAATTKATTTAAATTKATTTAPATTSKTTTIVAPTTSSKTTIAAPTTAKTSSTTSRATTFATVTRTTTAATTTTTAVKTEKDINKCLDEVNKCIRAAHSAHPRGGSVDISVCEAQRAACYN